MENENKAPELPPAIKQILENVCTDIGLDLTDEVARFALSHLKACDSEDSSANIRTMVQSIFAYKYILEAQPDIKLIPLTEQGACSEFRLKIKKRWVTDKHPMIWNFAQKILPMLGSTTRIFKLIDRIVETDDEFHVYTYLY